MPSRIRRLQPVIRLSERVLLPVQRLAHLAGISCSEVVEFFLTELFESESAAVPEPAPPPPPPARRHPATVIPIDRARRSRAPSAGGPSSGSGWLLARSAQLRERARQARDHAAAACERALRARDSALRVQRLSAKRG
jgi:hypothetical protein